MGRRIDAADTVDTVTNALHRLQSDGWMVKNFTLDIDSETPLKGSPKAQAARKLPVSATVTIELVPSL